MVPQTPALCRRLPEPHSSGPESSAGCNTKWTTREGNVVCPKLWFDWLFYYFFLDNFFESSYYQKHITKSHHCPGRHVHYHEQRHRSAPTITHSSANADGFKADFQPLNIYLPFHPIHSASEKSSAVNFKQKQPVSLRSNPMLYNQHTFVTLLSHLNLIFFSMPHSPPAPTLLSSHWGFSVHQDYWAAL